MENVNVSFHNLVHPQWASEIASDMAENDEEFEIGINLPRYIRLEDVRVSDDLRTVTLAFGPNYGVNV